ncbi:FAD-dependent oxidoreductase [Streptomyces sp. NPDC001941]|uniref:FAD-binding oxidoreductase n=1 Tax=Streptomyces sp. NPDC001941 TaxID=3154659 RepID=UPI003321BCAB
MTTRSEASATTPPPHRTPPESGRFRARLLTGVLRPRTPGEVADEVRAAAAHGGPPLHPVSTGRNWGLGSRSPVRDDTTLLDLAALDRVRDVDTERGYAVIEPGVTQGALAALLQGTARILNPTGASQHTSVIGNLLERGVGLHRGRADDLAGLEAVLADGTVVRTGWWPDGGGAAVVQPHGRGPSLNHLLTQSHLAAVTAAVVRLLPRPATVRVLPLTFAPHRLAEAVDVLRTWTAQHLVPPNTKVYDPVAARTYGVEARYLVHLGLTGDEELVDARARLIAGRAASPGSPFAEAGADAADAYVQRAYAGTPDPDDTLFLRKTGHGAHQLDEARGLLMFLPVVSFRGDAVRRAADRIAAALSGTTAPPGVTLNVLDADTVDHVVTLGFAARDPDAVRDAHRTLDRLHASFAEEGWHPYRPDIDHPAPRSPDDALRHRLEHALDPAGVFARSRY